MNIDWTTEHKSFLVLKLKTVIVNSFAVRTKMTVSYGKHDATKDSAVCIIHSIGELVEEYIGLE